jgi:hypothetical protein
MAEAAGDGVNCTTGVEGEMEAENEGPLGEPLSPLSTKTDWSSSFALKEEKRRMRGEVSSWLSLSPLSPTLRIRSLARRDTASGYSEQ